MEIIDLWGQVGAYVQLDPPADKLAVKALVDTGPAGREDLRAQAHLVVDGGRLRAEVQSVPVGFVPADLAEGHLGLVRSWAGQGRIPRVTARIRAFDAYSPDTGAVGGTVDESPARDGLQVYSHISLAEPHLVQPLNSPPTAPSVELPEGRKQKVTVAVAASSDAARPWIRPEGAAWVYCLLRPRSEQLARSTREVVEVWIDATAVGTLTPAMSKNFLPLIRLIVETGRLPVARGLLRGNHLQFEMSVAALKSSEVTQSWLREHRLAPSDGSTAQLAAPEVSDDPIETASSDDGADAVSGGPDGGREPGFYADPDGVADERFWDGFEWTTRIRMRPKPSR